MGKLWTEKHELPKASLFTFVGNRKTVVLFNLWRHWQSSCGWDVSCKQTTCLDRKLYLYSIPSDLFVQQAITMCCTYTNNEGQTSSSKFNSQLSYYDWIIFCLFWVISNLIFRPNFPNWIVASNFLKTHSSLQFSAVRQCSNVFRRIMLLDLIDSTTMKLSIEPFFIASIQQNELLQKHSISKFRIKCWRCALISLGVVGQNLDCIDYFPVWFHAIHGRLISVQIDN